MNPCTVLEAVANVTPGPGYKLMYCILRDEATSLLIYWTRRELVRTRTRMQNIPLCRYVLSIDEERDRGGLQVLSV